MAELRILQEDGKDILPVTHEDAVLDSEGKAISFKYITADNYDEGTDINIDFYDSKLISRIETLEDDVARLEGSTDISDELRGELNSLDNKINTTSDDLSSAQDRISTLEANLQEVFQRGNEVKSMFVDTLVAKGANLSTDNTFEELNTRINDMVLAGADRFPSFISTKETWLFAASPSVPLLHAPCSSVDEKIYILGGYDPVNKVGISTHYCFDTTTNTWSNKKEVPEALYRGHATVLNGKIHLTGSYATNTKAHYCYDPSNDSWLVKSSLPVSISLHTSAVVGSNLYVIGGVVGSTSNNAYNTNYCYDPSTDSWTTKTVLPYNAFALTSVVYNGKIYVHGGCVGGGNSNPLSNHYFYDPTTNSWSSRTGLPTATYYHTSALLDGKFYVQGGYNGSASNSDNNNQCYDPSTNTWSSKLLLPGARYHQSSAVVGKNSYIIDGSSSLVNNYCYIPDN